MAKRILIFRDQVPFGTFQLTILAMVKYVEKSVSVCFRKKCRSRRNSSIFTAKCQDLSGKILINLVNTVPVLFACRFEGKPS